MATHNGRNFTPLPSLNLRSTGGFLRFETPDTAWVTASGNRVLFADSSDNLIFDNGSTQITLASATGIATTWEQLFANDANLAMTATGMTFSQSGNAMVHTLTKTGTGAGAILLTNNAGTGLDFDITNTNEGDATGIIAQFHYDAGTPADDDIPLELRINADDDGGTETTLSTVRWYQRDVTAATDDAEFYMSLMVAGTERQVLQIDTDSVEIGNGNAAAVLSSSGAFDLVLETNRGTSTGTITITDGSNGNIQIAPDGTGILDLNSGFDIDASSTETCTITVVGTTGNGLAIDSATITSGDVVSIDHTSAATLNGGNLLALKVAGADVATFGEAGNLTIAGSASGTDALTLTAGDILLTSGHFDMTVGDVTLADGSVTITDADNASSLVVTNDTATSVDIVDFNSGSLTTGTLLRLTADTAVPITTGRMLEITADTATTAAGLVELTADALTTGIGVIVTSTSLDLAAGQLLNIDHTASGILSAAKTGQLVDIVSSRTHNSATSISDDYDAVSILRTSVNVDAGGTLNAAGSLLFIQNTATQTAGTLADTTNGIEIDMVGTAEAAGYAIDITHSGTTVGRAINIAASQTTSTVALLTMNSLTTTGVGLSLTNTGTGMTTGSVLRVASGTTGAVATNGIVSLFATGAFTSTAVTDGFVRVNANSTLSGTAVAINGNSFTTGVGLYIGDTGTGMTSGSLLRVSSGTTGAVATNGVVNFVATGAHTSTSNMGFVNVSDATATGVAMSISANSLTTGTGLRVASSGTITSSGVGLVHISGTGITSGDALRIAMTEATITTGNYINCYDGAASDFTVARYGATTIAGNAALTAALTITAGDFLMSDGVFRGATSAAVTADTGSAQGDGPITRSFVEISVCANAGDAVTLPSAAAGQFVIITNHGANAADVFPASGDTINEGTVNVATSIAAEETFLCWAYDTGNWEVTQLARNS